jgi:hypothetical protein
MVNIVYVSYIYTVYCPHIFTIYFLSIYISQQGGLTLGEYLQVFAQAMHWGVHEWYSFHARYGNDQSMHTTAYPPRNYSVVHMGHLTAKFPRESHTLQCAKLTLLREPVDRVVSAFYYHGHKDADWDDCFNSNCRLWWEYSNDVTRRFTPDSATWNSYDTEKYLHNDPLTRQSYEQAQQTLEQFQFICFIDNMRDCIVRLGRHYGVELDLPEELLRNVNQRRQDVSPELRQRIAAHNWMDVALFEWALRKFEE